VVLAAVGLVALVALAGCSAPGSITITPVDDTDLAQEASRSIAASNPEADEETRRIVREAVENGSTTATDRRPPVDDRERRYPFRYEGAYYRVNSTVVDEELIYAVTVEVNYDPGEINDTETVRASDLPPADREIVADLPPPRSDDTDGDEGFDVGASADYTPAELSGSRLVSADESTELVVVSDGERYLLRTERPREETRYTYRYTPVEVAPSDESYAQSLRDRYLFDLEGVGDAERDVLSSARNGTYYADGSNDEAFESLVDRFRAHGAVRSDDYEGEWLVRWNGQVYWAELRYADY
jgi:hypothetical protein